MATRKKVVPNYTVVVKALVEQYDETMKQVKAKTADQEWAEALLLQIKADDIEDQLRHAYKRNGGFYQD